MIQTILDRCTFLGRCLCCNAGNLKPVIDLGEQVPANAFHDGTTEQEQFPLRLVRCPACSHLQLSLSVDPQVLYHDYPYATGVSDFMVKHLEKLADWIHERKPGGRILEVGCNDGTLLKILQRRGHHVMGVEPAGTFAASHRQAGLPVIHGFWDMDAAKALGQKFDVIVGLNVLAHLRNPQEALALCDAVLKPDGFAVFEVHAGASVVLDHQFDAIYHEHLSYFTCQSIHALAKNSPFALRAVWFLEIIHGGSLRMVFGRGECPLVFPDPEAMSEPETYSRYPDEIEERKKDLLALVKDGCVCICASAKADVMLQTWKPSVWAAVDDNLLKIGKYMAGTKIPVKDFGWLREYKPKQIILGSWNLYDSLRPRLAAMLPGTELVSYQPKVKAEIL